MSFFTAWCFPFWPSRFLSDWVNQQKLRYALAAGFCFGLVFLTKPEIFVALAAGVVAAFVLFCVTRGQEGFCGQIGGGVSGGGRDSGAGIFSLFPAAWKIGATSLYATAFAWAPLWLTPVAQNPFYLWCTGSRHARFFISARWPSTFSASRCWWRCTRDCSSARRVWAQNEPPSWC